MKGGIAPRARERGRALFISYLVYFVHQRDDQIARLGEHLRRVRGELLREHVSTPHVCMVSTGPTSSGLHDRRANAAPARYTSFGRGSSVRQAGTPPHRLPCRTMCALFASYNKIKTWQRAERSIVGTLGNTTSNPTCNRTRGRVALGTDGDNHGLHALRGAQCKR